MICVRNEDISSSLVAVVLLEDEPRRGPDHEACATYESAQLAAIL